ncbi:MAG: IscS subfamily cysteine desulfurase, partial [Algiphilus sp.]
ALRAATAELAVASGSACSAAAAESSYVLRALGRDDRQAGAALRISTGRDTTLAQIDRAVAVIGEAVTRLRAIAA